MPNEKLIGSGPKARAPVQRLVKYFNLQLQENIPDVREACFCQHQKALGKILAIIQENDEGRLALHGRANFLLLNVHLVRNHQ